MSRNALRHGLFARAIVLDNERKQNFTILTKRYRRQIRPANALEESLVEELAATYWRMHRLWAMETRMLNQKMPDESNPDLGLSPELPGVLHLEQSDVEIYVQEMDRLNASFKTLAGNPEFRLVLHYQDRLHRAFQRALRGLMLLRKEKNPKQKEQTRE